MKCTTVKKVIMYLRILGIFFNLLLAIIFSIL